MGEANVLYEEAVHGLHLTEVLRHIAHIIVADIHVLAHALHAFGKAAFAVAYLIMLRMSHADGRTQQVGEGIASHLYVVVIVVYVDGHGRREISEVVSDNLYVLRRAYLYGAIGHITRVIFRRMPVAIGYIFRGKSQRLYASEAP